MSSAQLDLSSYTDPSVLSSFSSTPVGPNGVTLQSVGLDPSVQQAAQSAYSMLPASAQSAVGQVLNGFSALPPQVKQAGGDVISGALHGAVPLTAMMPLVSLGLAATGVGAPVAGLIAAAVPIAETVGQALGLFGNPIPAAHCDWIVIGAANPSEANLSGGDMQNLDTKFHALPYYGCFKGKRPFGPTDPRWVKWPDFVKKYQDNEGGNGNSHSIGAFPEWGIIYANLRDIANYGNKNYKIKTNDGRVWKANDNVKTFDGNKEILVSSLWHAPQPVRDFHTLYFYMWQANAEMAINGHKFASDANVLTAAIQAWNLHHKGGGTFTIKPASSSGGRPLVYEPSGSFIASLLNGDVDGQDFMPVGGPVGITLPTGVAPRIAVPASAQPIHLGKGLAVQPDNAAYKRAADAAEAAASLASKKAAEAAMKQVAKETEYHPAVILSGVAATGILGFLIAGPLGAAVGSVLGTVVGSEYKKKRQIPKVHGEDSPSFDVMVVRASGTANGPAYPAKDVLLSVDQLLAKSRDVAKGDAIVRAGRRGVPLDSRRGYDAATALLSYRNVPVEAYETTRNSLCANDRKGFDMAAALHLGRMRVPTPPKLLDTSHKRAGYYIAVGARDLGPAERASVMKSLHSASGEHSAGAQAAAPN